MDSTYQCSFGLHGYSVCGWCVCVFWCCHLLSIIKESFIQSCYPALIEKSASKQVKFCSYCYWLLSHTGWTDTLCAWSLINRCKRGTLIDQCRQKQWWELLWNLHRLPWRPVHLLQCQTTWWHNNQKKLLPLCEPKHLLQHQHWSAFALKKHLVCKIYDFVGLWSQTCVYLIPLDPIRLQ